MLGEKKKKQPDYKNQETQKSLVSVKSERAWPDCLLFMEVELGSQVRVLYLGGKQVESPEIVWKYLYIWAKVWFSDEMNNHFHDVEYLENVKTQFSRRWDFFFPSFFIWIKNFCTKYLKFQQARKNWRKKKSRASKTMSFLINFLYRKLET